VTDQPVADLIAERTRDAAVLAGIDTSQPDGRRAAADLTLHLKSLDEAIADEAVTSADGALHAKALDDAAADDRAAADLCPQPGPTADAQAINAATLAALVTMCRDGLNDGAAKATFLAAATTHADIARRIRADCSVADVIP
jgi:hypothetical protein